MNDFLQSLRNGQAEKQRTPKTRKNFDNSYHYTSPTRFHSYGGYQNNRSQHMKRPAVPHQPGNQLPMDESATTSLLAEAIETLSSHIETMAKNQDYLINAQERAADMMERQAIAIERIVDHLNIAPANEAQPEKEKTAKKAFENHYVSSQEPEFEITEPVEAPVEASVEAPVENIEPVKPVIRKRKKTVVKKATATASTANKLLSREAVMDIIHTMRADGATFDQVASRLIELGQPTFSGRGEWHAQTIHRLCNKK
ncbi:MAG: hypothetical protein GXP56_12105 [Deltaproteobacteria bacterium]|nr:hypothetical protein [Deltaproteobacteria bacterium]